MEEERIIIPTEEDRLKILDNISELKLSDDFGENCCHSSCTRC